MYCKTLSCWQIVHGARAYCKNCDNNILHVRCGSDVTIYVEKGLLRTEHWTSEQIPLDFSIRGNVEDALFRIDLFIRKLNIRNQNNVYELSETLLKCFERAYITQNPLGRTAAKRNVKRVINKHYDLLFRGLAFVGNKSNS